MSTAQGAVRQSDWIAVGSEIDLTAALSLTTQHACRERSKVKVIFSSSDILRCTGTRVSRDQGLFPQSGIKNNRFLLKRTAIV